MVEKGVARSQKILGNWMHVPAESGSGMTFRQARAPLPPSRGRIGFEFRPDGTFEETAPGASDRGESTTGIWSLEGSLLKLSYEDGRHEITFEVSESSDALVLSRR